MMFKPGTPTRAPRWRRGMTLIEFVTAISVSTLLIVGIHASLFITLKGLPSAEGPAATALQANRFLDRLATELESAIYVTELTATTAAFSLPDRDGDGLAERVRYAWSGIPGGALTRQYNGAAAETIAPQVDLFTLTPASRSVAETYPSLCVEDAAESLLIDYYSMTSTNSNDVTSTNWLAQHYTMTLPAGSYAWRPTRVDFAARLGTIPGLSFVEMRAAAANLTPTNEVLTQDWLTHASLTGSYTWQSYGFSQLDRIPSGGAICMVIERFLGSRSATILSTNAYAGLERSGDNGTSWNYDNSRSIVSRMYGKQFRSAGTQSVNSTYLTSLDMALRFTSTAPTLRTTVALLNHPELLSGKWELKFDANPTTVDVNGDGANDWAVKGGGAFNPASLVDSVWHTSGTELVTSPNCDFSKTTIVDLKMQNTSVGGDGATFSINALRSGSKCAPVWAYLKKQTDGTQTLKVITKTSDAQSVTLLNLIALPNAPVLLHLIIDPATSSLNIKVNEVQYGTYLLTQFQSAENSRAATIGASGSNAEFSYARIRVLEQ